MKITSELLSWCEALLQDERTAMEDRHRVFLAGLTREVQEGSSSMEWPFSPRAAPCEPKTSWAQLDGVNNETEKPTKEPALLNVAPDWQRSEGEDDGSKRKKRLKRGRSGSQMEQTFRQKPQTQTQHFLHPNRLARSASFELFFACMIVANSIAMACEMTYSGMDLGYRIGFVHFYQKSSDAYPWAVAAFEIAECFFGIMFTIECVIKILGLRGEFLTSGWNWFDTFLVFFWAADNLLQNLPLDSNMLRLVRLARLFRLIKIARTVQGFDSLVVMTTALQGSMSALFWVGVLLLFLQMMFALLLGQMISLYIVDDSLPDETREELFTYFGTFGRAILTMFELTLGNWVPVARILQEQVSGFFVAFSIVHKVTFGFACIGVVNGVFMSETLKVAHSDDVIMMREAELKRKLHTKKMQDFFAYADISGDGTLTGDEWRAVLQNDKVKMWFAGQGLTVRDADELFVLLQSTSGKNAIDAEELAKGVAQLQGPAKSLDITLLSREQNVLRLQVLDVSRKLQLLQAAHDNIAKDAENGETAVERSIPSWPHPQALLIEESRETHCSL